ncbi:MAG TPA: type IV secretory system conjugative DNA transfer family protein [Bacillota bacterium]|nr:type IV secretory system conjugative DNA transfer family protein [Bacillota bacterium]
MELNNKHMHQLKQQKNWIVDKTARYLEKGIKLKPLLPPLKWAGIAVGAFVLDAALLGGMSAGLVNSVIKAVSVFKGMPPPDMLGPGWYFTHPFKTSWIFLRHTLGAPINDASVYNTWVGLNIFFGLSAAVGMYLRKHIKKKRTEAGTSEFVDPSEAKDVFLYKFSPGIMFGGIKSWNSLKPVILRPGVRSNLNVSVFGPPGSGKSASYIKNNILQAVMSGWSIIVTDPKGEMVKEFAVWLEKRGYVVKIFNLKDMLNSDRWNPLSAVKDGISAQDFCKVVIANTSAPARKGGDDDFWANAELNLLKALVLYIVKELPPPQRNLGELYRMLASGDSRQLDKMFSLLPNGHPARLPYNLFCETTGTVRSGVILGLGNRLGVFQEKLVCELTSVYDETGINLALPGKKKCAYFCVLPDNKSTFNFLASLFFSFLFMDLMDLADRNKDNRLNVPVNFLLDEFCNIPAIPEFTKKLSTMRSRGIACSIIFQNMPQLQQMYPNKQWEVILGDCDYWLLLGAKELDTSKYISEIIGPTTIEEEKDTRPKGLDGLSPFKGSISVSPKKRMLLDSSEVSRLSPDEALLRIADGRTLKIQKMFYTKHPFASELEERHINEYMPPWAVEYLRKESLAGLAGAGGAVPYKPVYSPGDDTEIAARAGETESGDENAGTEKREPARENVGRDLFWG